MAIRLDQVRQLLMRDEPDYPAAARLGPQLLPHLHALSRGRDKMLASKATYLASLIDHDRAVDILRDAARSPLALVRVAAANGTRNLLRPAASAVILGLLGDRDAGVRKAAIKAASRRSNSALAVKVRDMSRADPVPALRTLAGRALSRAPGGRLA